MHIMQYVRIPLERVPVLIGENGETLRDLEKQTRTRMQLDDTSVEIEGDSMDEWIAVDVVKAVGRGFPPEKALKLLKEDMTLMIISLKDYTGTKKELSRKKGRIIGEKGRTRKFIEDITCSDICIYGNTVGIIGSLDDVEIAREAILRLIRGSQHAAVYRFLEGQRRQKIQLDYY
ncbi:MAG: RNA-processing protein [Candidatus Altiarchaeales archaeon ex4484_2]|nr:MAG: RNA-processing protein [Candidatus Altiarchaeales archaeon ex4484_2]